MNTTTELNEKDEPIALPVSLRDYFAAKAMQASLSLDPANAASSGVHARWAYEMADAMLKVRGETK